MDIARLGYEIDSSQSDKAAGSLDRMTAAAKRAEGGAKTLATGAKSAAAAAADLSAKANSAALSAAKIDAALNVGGAAKSARESAAAFKQAFAFEGAIDAAVADINLLGNSLDDLRAKYNPLYANSKQYEAELNGINDAARIGAITSKEQAAAVDLLNKRYAALSPQMGGINRAFGMNRQLMYQMVDIAQGIPLALQSPVYGLQNIAIQMGQVGQLYYGQGGMRAALKDMKAMLGGAVSSVLGLLTPVRLLGLGVAAAGALVVASALSWLRYGKTLDDVARQADTTTKSMAALNSAAAFKGISDKDFFSASENLAANIYDAKAGMGGLAELLAVNGKRAGTFEQTMGAVADIIKNAANDQQRLKLLQEAGLPANMQWVNLMRNGASGLEEAKRQAVAFGGAANDNMIAKAKEFGEAWDKAVVNLKTGFRGLFLDAYDGFQKLIDMAKDAKTLFKIGANGITSIVVNGRLPTIQELLPPLPGAKPLGQGGIGGDPDRNLTPSKAAVDPAIVKANIAAQQAYYNILGQTLTVDQQIASVENQIRQYHLDPKAIKLTTDQIANLERLAKERALGLDQIKAGTDAYNVEAASIGMSAEKAAAYALVQGQINEHIRNGNPLRADEIALLEQEGDKYAAAMKKANDLQFAKDGVKGFLSDLRQGLQNGEGFWKSFGNAALNVIDKIVDRIETNLVNALFDAKSAGGGSGGLFGSILGGIGSLFGGGSSSGVLVGGSPLGQGGIGHNAKGTDNWRGGLTWVGEKEPELIDVPRGARITPLSKMVGAGGSQQVTFSMHVTVDGNGDKELMARMKAGAEQVTAAAIAQYRRDGIHQDIETHNNDPRGRG